MVQSEATVAICIKYVRKLKNRVNKKDKESYEVSVNDSEAAGALIICSYQASANKVEVNTLKRNEQSRPEESKHDLKFHSPIYKLDPFVDNEGTLRVGGRLKSADLPLAIKHPVILHHYQAYP